MAEPLPTKKPGTSFRVSHQAVEHIKALAENFGLSKNALVAMLILRLAKFDDILVNQGLKEAVDRERDRGTLAQISLRLTPAVKKVLTTNATKAGLTQTEALEMAILDAARRESIA